MKNITGMNPEDVSALRSLEALAGHLEPRPEFARRLEAALKMEHDRANRSRKSPEILRYAGWAVAILALALFLNWLIGSLAPVPVPAAGGTATIVAPPTVSMTPPADSRPQGEAYEWRGTTLTINADLPAGPSEAGIWQTVKETPATLDSARALAVQFGLQGQAFQAREEIPGVGGFTISDGKSHLYVRSDQYYFYYPDYPAYLSTTGVFPVEDAESQIAAFMTAYGLDFPYRVQPSQFYGGYYVLPLAEDGIATRYDYFRYCGLLFRFNPQGIVAVEASTIHQTAVGTYAIRSAQEAIDWILDPNGHAGILEGMHSSQGVFPSWYRAHPLGTTVTIYAQHEVFQPLDGSAPLVTLDGYPVLDAGNIPGAYGDARLIHATGQFTMQDGIQVFKVESWEIYTNPEEGWLGTLQTQGNEAVLVTMEGETLKMPDLPEGLTLPMENVYVLGIKEGDTIQWRSFDLRSMSGGGGGGGGALGLYKLNLSGSPIPFPTPTPPVTALPPPSGFPSYTVVAGDTFASIAAALGITPEELMSHNGITDPATLYIGQVLWIPPAQSAEGWEGTLNVTIIQSPGGSERTQYGIMTGPDHGSGYYLLEGSDLSALDSYQNQPVQVWGTVGQPDPSTGTLILNVERYEIPYPDLKFTIVQGTQFNEVVNGETLTLLKVADAQTFVLLYPDGSPNTYVAEQGKEEVLVETLGIPGETYAGYPALRAFNSALAISPKTGLPVNMPISSDQPYMIIESDPSQMPEIPTAVIESVQLIYFTPDTRYKPPAEGEAPYVQPVWLFTGHYSNGDEFEILVQALKEEFLSPELEPIEPPG